MKMNKLGAQGPMVPEVCVGTSPLGGMPDIYGYDVDPDRAVATVLRALESGLNFIDTSNEYGDGDSERRIGRALRESGTNRQDVILASKADPSRGLRILDGSRARASFMESIERLGVRRLDLFYLHDPERFEYADMVRPGGALDTLQELKADGLVGLIGVAGYEIPELLRYLDTGLLDVVLNHNRYTLLDRSAEPLISACLAAEVGFVNAAPYASGVLAKPLAARPRHGYVAPSKDVVETVTWLHGVCGRFDVPLAALALQHSTRDERISSTVVGVSAPERVEALVGNASLSIPQDLWDLIEDRLYPGGDGS